MFFLCWSQCHIIFATQNRCFHDVTYNVNLKELDKLQVLFCHRLLWQNLTFGVHSIQLLEKVFSIYKYLSRKTRIWWPNTSVEIPYNFPNRQKLYFLHCLSTDFRSVQHLNKLCITRITIIMIRIILPCWTGFFLEYSPDHFFPQHCNRLYCCSIKK